MAQEVVAAVQEILERDGVLQSMRAKLRSTISHLLLQANPDDQVKTSNNVTNFVDEYEYGKMSLELVRDVLSSLGLVETLTVFDAECGVKSLNMSKDTLGKAVNIHVDSLYGVNKPILVDILGKYKRPGKLDQLVISTHSVDTDKHPILATSPKNRAPSPVNNRSPSPNNVRSNSPVIFNIANNDEDHVSTLAERRPNILTPLSNHSPIDGNSPSATSARSLKQLSVDTTSPGIDSLISSPNSSSGSVNILKSSPTNSVVSPGNKLSPSSSSNNRSQTAFTFRTEEKSSPPTASTSSLTSTKNLPPLGRPKSGKLEPITGVSSFSPPSKVDQKEGAKSESDLGHKHHMDINSPTLSALEESIEEVPENDSSQESSPEKPSIQANSKIYSLGRVSAQESGSSNSRILKVKESISSNNAVEQRAGVNVLKSTGGGVSRRQTGWNVDNRDDDNDDFVFTETVDNNDHKSSASIASRSPASPATTFVPRSDHKSPGQDRRNLDASDDLSSSYRSNQEDEDDYASPISKGSMSSPVISKSSQGFMVASNAAVNKSINSNKSDFEYGDDFEEDEEISEELDESIYEDEEGSGSHDSDEPTQSLTKTNSGAIATKKSAGGWANTASNTLPKKSNNAASSKLDMEDLEELSVASNDSDRYELSVGKSADSGGNDSFSFLSNSPNRNTTTKKAGNRSESDRSNDFSTHEYEVSDDHDSQYDFSTIARKR
jgi:hypothetical protein